MDNSSSPPYFNYNCPQSSAHIDTITEMCLNEFEYFCSISVCHPLVPNSFVGLGKKKELKKMVK